MHEISNQQNNSCHHSLVLFQDKQFDCWKGLPNGCSLSEVTALFPLLNEGIGTGFLGSAKVPFRMVQVEGYSQPVRAWLKDDHLLMLEVEYPELPVSLSTLAQQLGEPDVRLDCFWDTLRLTQGEWVYATQGIVLFVNPATQDLLRLAVFPSMTLDNYMKQLHLDLPIREF